MARLRDIIQAVQPLQVVGFADAEVTAVACHPDAVRGGGVLFACMDEYLEYNRWQTWRTHLERLPALGLAALITPEPVGGMAVPQLVVADPRRALGRAARLVTGCPDRELVLFGVTGTNGKTTTTRLLAHLSTRLGLRCASIGTLGVELAGALSVPGAYTTPLAPELYGHLAALRQAGAAAVAMEVSSHALALDRVEGLAFAAAVLTNIERDHLDFHGTQEAYAEAKERLFGKVKPDGWCVVNRHCRHFARLQAACSGRLVTYGRAGCGADFEAADWRLAPDHTAFTVRERDGSWPVVLPLVGGFQIDNALAALALLRVRGHSPADLAAALPDFAPVPGRMERIAMPNGCTAIVDYAHNPDGLRQVLENSRLLCRGRLHVVFGCGGDRDRGKRPIMGALAARLADVVWVTSDNPRTEDPQRIVAEIMDGLAAAGGHARVHTEVDRAAAIAAAYAGTADGDVLVVAGKGHEDYQIIGHTRHPFSDQAVLRSLGGR